MEFRVLGTLEVLAGEKRIALKGQQQQVVLAVLLANSGAAVSTERLIDEIWGERPPAAARKAIQSYVAQLRSAINTDSEVLVGRQGGYLIDPGPAGLDSVVFEREAAAARAELDEDPAAAGERLRRVLGLWRGAAYDHLTDTSSKLQVEAARLEELKLAALEARLRADLAVGDPRALVAELEQLVSQHPVRERFRALLMLVLYRAGRQSDALAAYQRARIALAEEIGIEPSAELRRLEQRILEQDPSLDGSHPLSVGAAFVPPERRNPYKGLRAFEESDASDFFGRRELVDRVTERLRRRDPTARFIALVGPSGSGKSSVVKAGIVPALRSGAVESLSDASVIVMYPGRDPTAGLEVALDAASVSGPLAEQAVVLIIDQFEEVFALDDPADGDAFLDTIADAVTCRSGGVHVIVTMRADFLDRALLHPELARLLDGGLELVPPLADHEVAAAITEPARRVGWTVEPALVAEMVHDVASRPATLPLMQYSLTDLFERASDEVIRAADYRGSGGILGALTRRADDLYSSMGAVEQETTRQLYLRLVTIGDEAKHLRRRVTRSELSALPYPAGTVDRVLTRYGQHRLLTFDRDARTGEPTVEVPHESLLREWPRLRDWIEASRSALILRRRLGTAATEWMASDREKSYTARGPLLADFENLATGSTVSLTETEHDYVRASRSVVDSELAGKSRRRRVLLSVLATATLVSLVLAGFALVQRRQADEQTRYATARELAAAALANIDVDPQRSILLALEAIGTTRSTDGTVLREAEEALHRAVQASRLVFALEEGPGVAFSPSGSVLATTTAHGSVKLWDGASGELATELDGSAREDPTARVLRPLVDVTFSHDGTRIAAATALNDTRGYATTTWDVISGDRANVAFGHTNDITSVSLSPDGSMLATSSLDTSVQLLDVTTAEVIGVLGHRDQVLDASFDPVGSRVAVASGETVHVWDVATQTKQLELEGHDSLVMSVDFLPDGDHIVSASLDGTARIWDLDDVTAVQVLRHSSAVRVARSDQSGQVIATGSEDGLVRLWDLSTGVEMLSLAGHTTPVDTLSFNAAGTLLASGTGRDSIARTGSGEVPTAEVRVWEVGIGQREQPMTVPARDSPTIEAELARLRFRPGRLDVLRRSSRLADVALSPDGHQMAVSGPAGQVTLWDTGTGRQTASLDGHDVPVTGIAYNRTGDELATSAADGVKTWDPATGALLMSLVKNDLPLRDRLGWYIDVEFSPDGETLAVSRSDRTLTLVDRSTGETIGVLSLSGSPNEIEYSPDGATIATGSDRAASLLIDTSGEANAFLHGALVDNVAHSPDGTRLATVSRDGTATMWDLTADAFGGTAVYSITAERLSFRAIAFSPKGNNFATGGDDGTVRIWNATDGSPQLTLQAHDGAVVEVAYGPDGTHLASISTDGTAKLHILDIDQMIALARSRLTRSFTEAECLQYLHQESCDQS